MSLFADRPRRVALLAVHHVDTPECNYTGGAEKYTRQVILALLDAGAAVHVGYSGTSIYDDLLAHSIGNPPRLIVERTGWLDEGLSGDARLHARTILARRRWLKSTGADTVFAVQQAGGGAFAASLIAARSLRLRVVASLRQLPQPLPALVPEARQRLIPRLHFWRRRLIWRRRIPAWCCHALIYNSQRVADAYHALYGFPAHRARIIYNGERLPALDEPQACSAQGIPISPAEPAIGVRRSTLGHQPCHIASVGRVTAAKGADTLLEAFARLAPQHPDVRLTYYGDGPLIPELKARAADLGLDRRVDFAGYRADHREIYRQVDVYVQPSRRESMSNSVVEAMARGIPCVVSDVGGLPETVLDGQTGFVVPPEEPERFAQAISRLLSDRDQFSRFSDASAARARQHFNLDRLMQDTVETILGLAPES